MPPEQPLPSEQATFAQHLFIQGYPLWNPSPDLLLPRPQGDGVRIGDVGIVDNHGAFDVFFNVYECLPGSAGPLPEFSMKNVHCEGGDLMPREALSSPVTEWHVEKLDKLPLSNITHTEIQYSTTLSVDGAHIILPRGAQLFELKPSHQQLFENHVMQHGKDWLELFRDRLESSRSDSLCILTGFYKTSSWSIASFSMQRAANTDPVSVRCNLVEADERTVQEESVWRPAGRFQRKIGPSTDLQGQNNQTIFIRGITVTRNPARKERSEQPAVGLLGKIFSFAWLPSPLAWTSTKAIPKSEVIIDHIPQTSRASHPSEIINRYLLEKVHHISDHDSILIAIQEPSAKIALTHDSQWIAMLKLVEGGQSWTVKDLEDRLEALLPMCYHIVTQNDAVYLREKEQTSFGGCLHLSHDSESNPASDGDPFSQ